MLNFWGNYPAVRLLIPFVAGIVLHILQPAQWQLAAAALFISVLAMLLCIWLKRVWLNSITLKAIGLLPIMAVIALAYLLTFLQTEIYRPHHFSKLIKEGNGVIGIIDEPPLAKEKSSRPVLQVRHLVSENQLQQASGRIAVSFMKDSLSNTLNYGDVILINAPLKEIEPPKNPEQFNYKEYMSFHNIYHQTFATSGKWVLLEKDAGSRFFSVVYKIRGQLMREIQKYVSTPDELGVAGALLLGYRDFITPEVINAYSASGALHVLCVSGLHVGMVYLILSKLLFFMNKNRRLRILQTFIIIPFIWLYACLTGLSPSVMRAATMFSMIAGGKAFRQQPDIYNIIGAAALVLMIHNPYIMTEVGFKLSYLAVIGIVYLHPLIYKWFIFKHKIADWFWSISAVSIAAQITTFPLGLLYFHQFPNLFLFSNLVVIPAGYLLIVSGISLFATQFIEPLQYFIGTGFYWLSLGLNKFIFLLNEFPYSIIQGVSISGFETILIYASILLLTLLLQTLKPKLVFGFLTLMLALVIWNSYEYINQRQQVAFKIYAVKNKQAMAAIAGNEVYNAFNHQLRNNKSSMLFHIQHDWWKNNIANEHPMQRLPGYTRFEFGYAFQINSKKVIVIDSVDVRKHLPPVKINADVMVLTNNPKLHLKKIVSFIDTKLIVADATNTTYQCRKWQQQASELNLPFHDVLETGAFEI